MKIKIAFFISSIMLAVFFIANNVILIGKMNSMTSDGKIVDKSGVVRGCSQRLTKMEIYGRPSDNLVAIVDGALSFLENGDPKHGVPKRTDAVYREKIDELKTAVSQFKTEILQFRNGTIKQDALITRSESLWDITNKITHDLSVQSANKHTNILRLGIAFSIINVILVFFVQLFLSRSIFAPLGVLKKTLENIAHGEGDLRLRLSSAGKDEIAELSKLFNQTIEKMGGSIKTVSATAADMETVGSELAGNMVETASTMNEMSANIASINKQMLCENDSINETASLLETITGAIKSLSGNITGQAEHIAKSSDEIRAMISHTDSIGKMLDESKVAVQKLYEKALHGKENSREANENVAKISEKSDSLLEASSVIQNIAEQTNLLAMNAAIEAAHAGESGKGFAVVADEIRKLAEESNVQGKQIGTVLKESIEIIKNISVSNGSVELVFNETFSAIENLLTRIEAIAQAMDKQADGSDEILKSMEIVHNATGAIQEESIRMLSTGKNAEEGFSNLIGLTMQVKNSIAEMAQGIAQVNNAVQEINAVALKNKSAGENLLHEVNKFKV